MPTPETRQAPMTFQHNGAGEPLVLIHGSVNDSRYWAPQMAAFAAHFETFALDLRHYWPNSWDGQSPFSIDGHIEDVARFIETLARGPVRLLGHSRGGYIAFRLAERRPDLVARLALAEPAGVLDASLAAPGAPPANYAALISAAVESVRRGETELGLEKFFDYAIGAGGWAKLPEERRQICRDNAVTLIGQIGEGRTPYARASAEAIHCPTLIVDGGATQPVFAAIAAALAGAIPLARRVTLPGATHLLNWDDAAGFNAAILSFLAEV